MLTLIYFIMCFHFKTKTINTYSLHNNVIVIIARHNYASLFRIVSNKSSKSCGNSACLSIFTCYWMFEPSQHVELDHQYPMSFGPYFGSPTWEANIFHGTRI